MNDASDLEVAKKSVAIINKLLKLLQQYGVVEETCGRATFLPCLVEYNVSKTGSDVLVNYLNKDVTIVGTEKKNPPEESYGTDDKKMVRLIKYN